MAQGRIAGLSISPDKIHIRSPYLAAVLVRGICLAGPQVLGILRRVWLAGPSNSCCAANTCTARWAIVRRPARRCAWAADSESLLTAIDHHAKTVSSSFDDFFEPAADASHPLYASPPSPPARGYQDRPPARRFSCVRRRGNRVDCA